MRIATILAATAALALSAPASAQQSQGQSQTQGSGARETVDRVLDTLLGPRRQQEAAPQEQQVATEQANNMNAVLLHPRRAEDRARDAWRHPAETLDFFRVQPGMTVVDFMPAGGWYSRVLIPYLGRDGNYIGLDPEIGDEFSSYWDTYRNTASRLPRDARQWVGLDGARVYGLNTDDELDAYAGTADRVLIFREIHNMRRFGWFHDAMVAIRTLLKDDGLVGVVQHRARTGAPASYTLGDNGYQRQQDVIALFSAYGFELVEASEINANPRDPADWEDGVWSLPPSYRGAPEGSEERARRAEIGESDRMTLLFRKRP
ncbi:class I SAM-dependent methyltransferase [Aurantiacibacter gilvus]|uniref:Methyltransferase n=1 Tax=Aurantiacibacter gilvus TaxID=3139141 RepID=A0ABU9IGE2_9SPHN